MEIVEILQKELQVTLNEHFNPVRNKRPDLSKMTMEQKQEIIRKNPDYGIVVCRCEGISKGEILDAIHSPVPALSLDAIKRRVRPGMGRCQGGFCSPQVLRVIARETKSSPVTVTKNGGASKVLLSKTKGECDE
jgi:glycerol-3-phosphate dehydrogenase